MKHFVFCKSDLILEKVGDQYQIPTEPPTDIKPWTTVLDVAGAKAWRIESPLLTPPSTLHTPPSTLHEIYFSFSV